MGKSNTSSTKEIWNRYFVKKEKCEPITIGVPSACALTIEN